MEADCALSEGACAFIRLKVNAKTYQAITFNVFVDSTHLPWTYNCLIKLF